VESGQTRQNVNQRMILGRPCICSRHSSGMAGGGCGVGWKAGWPFVSLSAPVRGETSGLVCKVFFEWLCTAWFGLKCRDSCIEFIVIALETFDVFHVIVERAILPAAPHDALPFEGQSAAGGVAAFAAMELHLVIALSPDAKRERSARQCQRAVLGATCGHFWEPPVLA